MLKKIFYKRNERLEIEFFENKECTMPFDFEGKEHLYIELRDGDLTPFLEIYQYTQYRKLYLPYFPNVASIDFLPSFENIYTLDDITPNLSKYIPENNAVLFLNDEDFQSYKKYFLGSKFSLLQYPLLDKCNLRQSLNFTIFAPYGTQETLKNVNEVAEELKLKEKYGATKVNVFIRDCFVRHTYDCVGGNGLLNFIYKSIVEPAYKCPVIMPINKIITTNSTGLPEPKDSERLQVIDCFDIFNDTL